MPLNIHKKKAKPDSKPVEAQLPKGVTPRPLITKQVQAGSAVILPDVNLQPVAGGAKFLIHLHKVENGTAIWYRVEGYDETTGQIKLRSRHANTFGTQMHPSVALYYMVVVEPAGATAPSDEAFNGVKKLTKADPIQ